MEPDLSEFGPVTRPGRGKCWFTRLTPEQQEKALGAYDIGHTAKRIAAVVTSWGVLIGPKGVGEHFRGGCACD